MVLTCVFLTERYSVLGTAFRELARKEAPVPRQGDRVCLQGSTYNVLKVVWSESGVPIVYLRRSSRDIEQHRLSTYVIAVLGDCRIPSPTKLRTGAGVSFVPVGANGKELIEWWDAIHGSVIYSRNGNASSPILANLEQLSLHLGIPITAFISDSGSGSNLADFVQRLSVYSEIQQPSTRAHPLDSTATTAQLGTPGMRLRPLGHAPTMIAKLTPKHDNLLCYEPVQGALLPEADGYLDIDGTLERCRYRVRDPHLRLLHTETDLTGKEPTRLLSAPLVRTQQFRAALLHEVQAESSDLEDFAGEWLLRGAVEYLGDCHPVTFAHTGSRFVTLRFDEPVLNSPNSPLRLILPREEIVGAALGAG